MGERLGQPVVNRDHRDVRAQRSDIRIGRVRDHDPGEPGRPGQVSEIATDLGARAIDGGGDGPMARLGKPGHGLADRSGAVDQDALRCPGLSVHDCETLDANQRFQARRG